MEYDHSQRRGNYRRYRVYLAAALGLEEYERCNLSHYAIIAAASRLC